ncbi:MAG: SGNH/GDSL hydrolase family protein [Gammaproteobacteria bacterium]|nr:SGNH/GDSL hydrolase family protein [Gammaproteobacteria bacterium]
MNLIVRVATLVIGGAMLALAFSDDVRIVGGPGLGLTELILLVVGGLNVAAAFVGGGFLAGWLVCQVSVVATLAVAEFALRLTVAPRYLSPFQLDDRYLYDLVPGARREYRHMPVNGGTQLYSVNSFGFRGAEFDAARSAKPRVVIYGDSFIQAEYTALENTLAVQLAERLTSSLNAEVEVINAGVAGYGPDQVLRRVEDELEWLQPDLLIVAVFTGNDFGDLVRNKLYRLSFDGQLIENEFRFSDEIQLNASLETSEPVLRKVGRQAKAGIQAMLQGDQPAPPSPLQRTEERLEQHVREYKEFVISGDNVVYDLRTDPYSADIALQPDSDSAQYKIRLMKVVVAAIQGQAEESGVPLLLIGIPHPMDVLGGKHASGEVDTGKYPAYEPTRLTGTLQDIAARLSIDHINLYPHFAAVDDPAALYLLGGDDHWNDVGQSLAADVVARYIEDRGYLKSD